MPGRRRTRTAEPEQTEGRLVIGIVGTAVLGKEEIQATIDDLLSDEKSTSAEFIFAFTESALGPEEDAGAWVAFEYVAELKKENTDAALTIKAVTDPKGTDEDKGMHDDAKNDGVVTIPVQDQPAVTVADELVKAKSEGADARLVVFWVDNPDQDGDPGGQYAAVESADQGGVKAFNICKAMDDQPNKMEPLEIGAPEPEQPAAAEEPPTRSRRGRRAASEETAPADEAQGAEAPRARRGRRAATTTPDTPPAETAPSSDEAQAELPLSLSNGHADLSDSAVGDILESFAALLAEKVVRLLQAESAPAEAAPARRGRRSS